MTSITITKLAQGYTLRGGEHHGIIAAASTLAEALALAERHLADPCRAKAPPHENRARRAEAEQALHDGPPKTFDARKLDGSPVVPRHDAASELRMEWERVQGQRRNYDPHPSDGT